MKGAFHAVLVLIVFAVFAFISPVAGHADEGVPRMSTEELSGMLGEPGLAILDTRIVKDWRKAKVKIKGADRVDPHDVSSWASDYRKDQKIVVYCA
jgi:hypothetical protein